MDINFINSELKKPKYLRNIEFFPELDSTNDFCKKNISSDHTLIITENQLSGKGRFNRFWQSQKGKNLTITLVKDINIDIKYIFLVNLYTSLCILKVLKKKFLDFEGDFFLKWPNDILLNRKKICGILTEVVNINEQNKKFYIGIGLNINQTPM